MRTIEDIAEYQKLYRERIMKTRKPGHEDSCVRSGCCYHGRRNANRLAMRRIRAERPGVWDSSEN